MTAKYLTTISLFTAILTAAGCGESTPPDSDGVQDVSLDAIQDILSVEEVDSPRDATADPTDGVPDGTEFSDDLADIMQDVMPDTGIPSQCPANATQPAGIGETVGNLVLPIVRQGQDKEWVELYDTCKDPGELRYIWIMRVTTVCTTCVEYYEETINELFYPKYSGQVAVWMIVQNPFMTDGATEDCFPNIPTGWEKKHHPNANFPLLHDCEGAETAKFLDPVSGAVGVAAHYIIEVPSMKILSVTDEEGADINDIIPFFESKITL